VCRMGAVLHSGLCKQCSVKSAFGHGHSHGGGGHSHGGRGGHHSHGSSSHGHSHGRHCHDDDHSHVHSSAVVLNSQNSSRTGNGYSTLSLETMNDDDGLLLNETCDGVTTVTATSANHEQRTNINVRAAMVHVIGDLIQSFGVLIAAIVVHVRVNSSFVFCVPCMFWKKH
jgi:solute carrier family 30 (zinc transporter), member 2